MGISDRIETFIQQLLKDEPENGWLELKRNELASIFNCVPSQINYVISTRFNPQKGYVVESRRGGGGYIRIKRISYLYDITSVLEQVGSTIDASSGGAILNMLTEQQMLSPQQAELIYCAISDNSLPLGQPQKDMVRAALLKNMLAVSLQNQTERT
jgi:transcriptional regulator CtsR